VAFVKAEHRIVLVGCCCKALLSVVIMIIIIWFTYFKRLIRIYILSIFIQFCGYQTFRRLKKEYARKQQNSLQGKSEGL